MNNIIKLFAAIALLSSCSNYYKVITVNNPDDASSTATLNIKNGYFILHADSIVFAMENISLAEDNKKVKCFLSVLPDNHKLHLPDRENKRLVYKAGKNEYDETGVLKEVHFYISSNTILQVGQNEVYLNQLNKIDRIEKDKKEREEIIPSVL